jgi:hypothetical protein
MGTAMAKATDWAAISAWAAWATVVVYVVLGNGGVPLMVEKRADAGSW